METLCHLLLVKPTSIIHTLPDFWEAMVTSDYWSWTVTDYSLPDSERGVQSHRPHLDL